MKNILNIDYEKYKLDNGLEVILYPNKRIPLVAVNIWYKVGSANESPEHTGFAHLFEHMMFQGSENVPKEMHFRYIQEAGGTLNGSTSFDRTNYFETVPSDSLELALWLEADRMGFLLPALTEEKLQNQKEVVMNERRQRYENQPYGLAWEKLFFNLFGEGHPYSWPTIGYMEHIENFELEQVKKFFRTYYSPSNASLVVAGNFDITESKEIVEKYFGTISDRTVIPRISFERKPLGKNITEIYEDAVELDRLYIAWQSDKLFGKDDAALDILSDILGGSKNSRLNKALVFDKQIAQDVSCFQYSGKLDGAFIIMATAKPDTKLDILKNEIINILKEIVTFGIEESELDRAKNSIKSSYIYSMQNITSLADQINNYNYNLGNPNGFDFDLSRFAVLTTENIKDTADKYLSNFYTELRVVPKNSEERK